MPAPETPTGEHRTNANQASPVIVPAAPLGRADHLFPPEPPPLEAHAETGRDAGSRPPLSRAKGKGFGKNKGKGKGQGKTAGKGRGKIGGKR